MVDIKEVEYIGSENIPKELARLEKMSIDPINYKEVLDQYTMLLKNLDTVARQETENHSKIVDDIKDTVDKIRETIPSEQWENDVWYKKVYDPMYRSLDSMYQAFAYFSTMLQIQKILIKRLTTIVESYKGTSEQKIVVQTLERQYEKLLEENRKMNEKMFEMMRSVNESKSSTSNDVITTLINAIMQAKTSTPPSGQSKQTNLTASDKSHPAKTQHEKDIEMDAQEEPMIREAVLDHLKKNLQTHQNTLYKHVSEDGGFEWDAVVKVVKKMKEEGLIKSTGVAGSALSAAEEQ